MKRILLVDSHETECQLMRDRLEKDGYAVSECRSAAAALEGVAQPVDAVVVNRPLNDVSSLDLMRALRAAGSPAQVIIVGASSTETIAALRQGAYYVARTSLDPDEVSFLLERALTSEVSATLPPACSNSEDVLDGSRPTSLSERRSGLDYQLPSQGIDFRDLEREVLAQALHLASGNQTRAATLLGMTRDQIRYRMAKFGMSNRDLVRRDERAA